MWGWLERPLARCLPGSRWAGSAGGVSWLPKPWLTSSFLVWLNFYLSHPKLFTSAHLFPKKRWKVKEAVCLKSSPWHLLLALKSNFKNRRCLPSLTPMPDIERTCHSPLLVLTVITVMIILLVLTCVSVHFGPGFFQAPVRGTNNFCSPVEKAQRG